jgi:hypothetical protein
MHRLVAALLLLTLPSCAQSLVLPEAPSPQQQTTTTRPLTSATPSNPAWYKVQLLNTDDPIAVLERGRRDPVPCRLDRADDAILACNLYAPNSAPRRIVYPIANIQAIYLEEEAYGPTRTAILLGTGVGAAVGGAVCNEGSARVILTCTLIGAALGASIVFSPRPSPFPPTPHLRRRLIYRAP